MNLKYFPEVNIPETIDTIIQFISNNFELILYTDLAILIMYLSIIITIKIRETKFKKFVIFRAFRQMLYMAVIVGQLLMVTVTGYVYWVNYQRPEDRFKFPDSSLTNSRWVKDKLRIYYIKDTALYSLKLTGEDERLELSANSQVREYHFSPDGQKLLAVCQRELYLVDLKQRKSLLIDKIEEGNFTTDLKGVISGVRWAPDNQKFVYYISKWSNVSSHDYMYLYDIQSKKKRPIKSPTRKFYSLYWDLEAQNLYYLFSESKDAAISGYPYEIKVLHIPLDTLETKFLTQIPSTEGSIPIDSLNLRDIELYFLEDQLSFGQTGAQENWLSEKGSQLGIDDKDHLYIIRKRWFKKRLFQIPRKPVVSELPRYQYKGGDLTLTKIRWLPGGRYVIMENPTFGVFVLDPDYRKMGHIVEISGSTLGWYQKPIISSRN